MAAARTLSLLTLAAGFATSTSIAIDTSVAASEPRPKRIYHAVRISGPAPHIDGKLDDPCWAELGEWAGDFIQREPHEGLPGSEPTLLKILYDDASLYVAFRCFDSQLGTFDLIRGKRDEFTGEMVGIAFDSFFDRRTAFEFDVTAGGSQLDLVLRNDGWDTHWNAVWESQVGREDDAWTAEFRIPLSQLRYSKAKTQVWGLHSWRWIKRHQEESNWNLLPMDNSGLVHSFGELHGLEDLRAPRQIEILPYAVGRYSTSEPEPGNPFRTGSESDLEFGLDAKIGLTSNFTLDATINPDFGQVEADPSELNLSTFETFYSERRPFFIEGRNTFEVPLGNDLSFYSRRIGHAPSHEPKTSGHMDMPTSTRILAAAKVTGKTPSGLAVGVLYAGTDREIAQINEEGIARTVTVEPASHYFVGRLQQDLNDGDTVIGGILTTALRDINEPQPGTLADSALTGGADLLQYWNDRTWSLNARVIASEVAGTSAAMRALMEHPVHNYQRPDATHVAVVDDADHLSGHGGMINLGKRSGGPWRYRLGGEWRSPGLELNDLGFLSIADWMKQTAAIHYIDTEPGPNHRKFDLHLNQDSRWDWAGTHLQDSVDLNGSITFPAGWSLWGKLEREGELLDTRVLRGGPALRLPAWRETEVELSSDGGKNIQARIFAEYATTEAGGSDYVRVAPRVSGRVGDSVNLSTSVGWEQLNHDAQYATTATTAAGAPRYILGRMAQETLDTTIRLDLNFTPRLSLTYFGNVYLTAGDFEQFKNVTAPRAGTYTHRFARLDNQLTYHPTLGNYTVVDPVGGDYSFADPDFNWRSLRSNLVLRWEYRAGSTLYVVWTQNRASSAQNGMFSPRDEFEALFSAYPENTLLLKLSYWFSI
jgi:hypothetical protein